MSKIVYFGRLTNHKKSNKQKATQNGQRKHQKRDLAPHQRRFNTHMQKLSEYLFIF